MGSVHFPLAFSSSIRMVMMGTSFCLLSSLEMKPLSSYKESRNPSQLCPTGQEQRCGVPQISVAVHSSTSSDVWVKPVRSPPGRKPGSLPQ